MKNFKINQTQKDSKEK